MWGERGDDVRLPVVGNIYGESLSTTLKFRSQQRFLAMRGDGEWYRNRSQHHSLIFISTNTILGDIPLFS